jgi:hypothetical protein
MAVTSSAPVDLTSNIDPSTTAAKPNWIVAVSASEASSEALAPSTERAAQAAFSEHGCVLLRGAFPPAVVEAMHREFAAQFGTADLVRMGELAAKPAPKRLMKVSDARYDIVLRMTGAFGHPQVFANGLLLQLLRPLLGQHMLLNSLTAVVSHPSSQQQGIHRDYPHLFDYARGLPAHAVTAVVPLIDVDLVTGPTGVWLGSHLWDSHEMPNQSMTVSALERGDCMLMDYRLMHAGLPNRSGRARPMVYMVYARPWFFDQHNHLGTSRNPVDMPLERYNELPPSVRPLLARAHYNAMLSRWGKVDAPTSVANQAVAASDRGTPAPQAKASRNKPCPCGSGKKYKHCHGQSA